MEYPDYSYPPRTVVALIRDVLLTWRRPFRQDALACIGRLKPSLQVLGKENIPRGGPCVVTVNHYYRPGFAAQWIALAIAATVPVDMHWIMTGELTYPGKWYAPLGMGASRFALHRIARVYGFTAMPPMPPRPKDVETRARAVRAVLDFVKRSDSPVLGLAPEGGDAPAGRLTRPASGLGRFGLLLSGAGLKFTPVSAYEADGTFCLRFGPAYQLRLPSGLATDEKDHAAATIIMQQIAELSPDHLRGEFNGRA